MKRAALIIALLVPGIRATAEDCSVRASGSVLTKDSVVLTAGSGWSGTTAATTTMNAGADYWRDSCSGTEGSKFPTISVGGSATGAYPVTVNFVNVDGGRCGVHSAYTPPGATLPVSSTITLFASAGGASCAPIADVLAHELGHVLGLRDPNDASSCDGSIMGGRAPGGTRIVTADDCAEVDKAWLVTAERPTPTALTPNPVCPDSGCSRESPIVLALGDENPYRFTSADDGVDFDIRDEGRKVAVAWTLANSKTAFLALDRNGNGRIDNGAELFGNATPLHSGARAANGFEALREFDDNDDGVVDAADLVWSSLVLWTDHDHDGISSPGELQPIAAAVKSLSTAYHRVGRKDRWGNELVFQSAFRLLSSAADEPRPYYDVFFLTQ
jgi:hypothetical protein